MRHWIVPLLVAPALGFVFNAGPIASATLFGLACAVAMRLAGRPMPLQFAAFAMFAAVAFGFMAAVFAAMAGNDVHQMLAAPLSEQFVGISLGWLAVAFLGLAAGSATITWLRGSGEAPATAEGSDSDNSR
jgi:hypothetical protein